VRGRGRQKGTISPLKEKSTNQKTGGGKEKHKRKREVSFSEGKPNLRDAIASR